MQFSFDFHCTCYYSTKRIVSNIKDTTDLYNRHSSSVFSGYVSRQAIYACMTCTPDQSAGICLACSYDCHDGHDLYELYTKRNFQCDCGNKKFDSPCKLYKNKSDYNADNKYGQNYKGLYCVCARPYPDPEDEIEDEMIQCSLCEDWYHGRHLGFEKSKLPSDYSEMVCVGCMHKHEFLRKYQPIKTYCQKKSTGAATTGSSAVDVNSSSAATTDDKPEIDVTSEENTNKQDSDKDVNVTSEENANKQNADKTVDVTSEENTNKDALNTSQNESSKLQEKMKTECLLSSRSDSAHHHGDTATFWTTGWRHSLCRCDACKEMYNETRIEFLLDDADTVAAYENRGKDKQPASQYDKGMAALSSMDRFQQVEVC